MNRVLNKSVPFFRFLLTLKNATPAMSSVAKRHFVSKALKAIGAALTLAIGLSACANSFGFGGTSWQEETLLHDGSKIIVKRSQSHGGRHEPGQSAPVKEHTISFALPKSGHTVSWTSEYGEDIGRANFNALALHVHDGTPYLVVEPNLCLSYNKWGRPNPPYLFLKYEGESWHQISLSELPAEFSTINLIVNIGRETEIKRLARESGYVTSEGVQEINSSLRQPEYRSIWRETLPKERIDEDCPEMLTNGKGRWFSVDWFTLAPTYQDCVKVCGRQEMLPRDCPCATIFEGK